MQSFDPANPPLPIDFYRRKYSVSKTTMWRWQKNGLAVLKVGGKCFVRQSEFVAFLEKMNGKRLIPEQGGK